MHGIWLWLRRLPIRPRPAHHQEGVQHDHHPDRRSRPTAGPASTPCPTGPARAGLAPRSPARLFARRRRPARRHRPRRRRDVRAGRPGDDRAPARRVLRPARPRRADRLRRGLPHRRLGRRGPRRLPHRARRRACRTWSPSRCSGCAHSSSQATADGDLSSTENSRDNIAHHYDLSNDLFELFLDPTLSYSSALFAPTSSTRRPTPRRPRDRPGSARSTGCSTRPASAPAPGCSRSAPAGASSRSAPPPRGATVRTDHAVDRAAGAGRRAHRGRRRPPTGSTVELCDYRDVDRRRTTPSCRSR